MIKSCAMGSCIKVVKYFFWVSYRKKKVFYRLSIFMSIMEGKDEPLSKTFHFVDKTTYQRS
jgi:hypothetical protein